jgi:hypothetical protein
VVGQSVASQARTAAPAVQIVAGPQINVAGSSARSPTPARTGFPPSPTLREVCRNGRGRCDSAWGPASPRVNGSASIFPEECWRLAAPDRSEPRGVNRANEAGPAPPPPVAAPLTPAPTRRDGVNKNPDNPAPNDALPRYLPGEWGEDSFYAYHERLGIADDLGLPTDPGSTAWMVAVGESMIVVAIRQLP